MGISAPPSAMAFVLNPHSDFLGQSVACKGVGRPFASIASRPNVQRVETMRETKKQSRTRLHQSLLPDVDSFLLAVSTWSFHTHDSVLDKVQHLLQSYQTLLTVKPVTTKATTSAILAVVADLVAQISSAKQAAEESSGPVSLEEVPFEYNTQRGLAFFAFGALYTGTFQHYWFEYLSSHIAEWGQALRLWTLEVNAPVENFYNSPEWWTYFDLEARLGEPPSDAALAIGKLVVNQFVIVPFLYMPLFFGFTGALNGLNPRESFERAKSMFVPLMKRNYVYWLPVQFIQFFALPSEWQIPYVSMASLIWTSVLSSILSSPQAPSSLYVSYTESRSMNHNMQPSMNLNSAVTENVVVGVNPVLNDDATDDVQLHDVENLVPSGIRSTLIDPKLGGTTAGGLIGLLAAALNDGFLSSFIAPFTDGFSGAVGFFTALGAALGLLATSNQESSYIDVNVNDPDEGEVYAGEASMVVSVTSSVDEANELSFPANNTLVLGTK